MAGVGGGFAGREEEEKTLFLPAVNFAGSDKRGHFQKSVHVCSPALLSGRRHPLCPPRQGDYT